jgi:hypothetical protein
MLVSLPSLPPPGHLSALSYRISSLLPVQVAGNRSFLYLIHSLQGLIPPASVPLYQLTAVPGWDHVREIRQLPCDSEDREEPETISKSGEIIPGDKNNGSCLSKLKAKVDSW